VRGAGAEEAARGHGLRMHPARRPWGWMGSAGF
jgi:hypothetical protein